MAPRALESRADQHALELGLRVIEERPLGCERAPIGPALERGGPVGVLGRTRRGAGELLREVAHVHLAPGGEHREPPTEVHELADVSRPLVRGEPREGIGGEQLRLDAELVRGDQKIVGEEVGDVLGARPQRGQLDQDDVETVIEILAEQAARHALLQALVGRGDDAHVDADRGLAADAVELALGEHPQEPRLERQRHVADLVEEERAAVGLLEAAAALRIRPGEGAALVSEQLRLEQIRGDRSRVERDEGTLGARAVLVQRPGDELLAGARLPGDEHRDARARQAADGAEHLLHRGRRAEELGHPWRPARVGPRLLTCARGAAHERDRLVDVEGLRQVLEGAALVGRHRIRQIRVRGHHDDRELRARIVDALEELEPRGAGHADVGDQDIGRLAPERIERRLRGLEGPRRHAVVAQRPLEHPADGGVVVDEPDTQCASVHGSSPRGSSSVNTVRPSSLSNSMMPPLRVTRSCATARPRPVPLARPVTSG